MSTPDQILKQYEITLSAGHADIPPADGAAAAALAAIHQSNAAGRLEGLPDDLNMMVLDKQKVKAFLDGLPKLPSETLENLRGKTLNLADSKLQLYAYSPVQLERGYTLATSGATRLQAPIDHKLARQRADHAKQAMLDVDREATELEKRKKQPNADSAAFVAHSTAERKRYSAATVWRNLVNVLAAESPNDRALQAEAAQAKQAASKYITAPWTGMP